MLDKTQIMGVVEDVESDLDVGIARIKRWLEYPNLGRTHGEVLRDANRLVQDMCNDINHAMESLRG